MTDEEKERLKLALRVMAKIDKVGELNEAEFRLLGFNEEYENYRGQMEFYPPTRTRSNYDIRVHCVDIVFQHIVKETGIA